MLAIAVTHKLPDSTDSSMREQLLVHSRGLLAIGTKVRGLSTEQMDGDARRDIDLLARAGEVGAVAVVRYELGGVAYLACVRARERRRDLERPSVLADRAARPQLPDSLLTINTKGRTICELSGPESSQMLAEWRATRPVGLKSRFLRDRLAFPAERICGRQRRLQHGPPAKTRKKASMSASVPRSPSLLKSALKQWAQQFPPRQAKNASMSASVPTSPSPLKSAGSRRTSWAG